MPMTDTTITLTLDVFPSWRVLVSTMMLSVMLFNGLRVEVPIQRIKRGAEAGVPFWKVLNRRPFTCDVCMSLWCSLPASLVIAWCHTVALKWEVFSAQSVIHFFILWGSVGGLLGAIHEWRGRKRVNPARYFQEQDAPANPDDLPPVGGR